MPQGFGFEPRRGDRRQPSERRLVGMDRRAGSDRRSDERSLFGLGTPVDHRLNAERRAAARRAALRRDGERRALPDRRSPASRASDGLRVTQHGFRFRPSDLL
jgi:hypothetical protein